ncbi:ABC transporter substrate-binding protein [Sphingomonas oleivorans]|nr:ABC transporter substrate-binding protein [Sphingomonas oleivorans]
MNRKQDLLIDRRGAMGLIAGAGLATLGGCGLPATRPPVKGGRIRVATAVSSTADTLDPAKQAVAIDYCRCASFYNGLTRLNARSEAEPALAEAMETKDARVWIVKLRRDVRFHDGSPLTPADVVYSLRRHADPAVASQGRAFANQFEDVSAFGPDAVRITLGSANADLPVLLAIPSFLIIRDGTRDFRTANGTGPFRCAEFNPGVRSIGVRNEDYWRGPVRLGEVELFSIADESARLNALMSGDVDLVNGINPRITKQVVRQGYEIFESKGSGYTNLIMRLDSALGRNRDFVLGMKSLMDRETMRNAIFRGYARIANDHPVPPSSPYFDPGLPQRAFDPERARFHFRKAGLAGATVPIITSPAAEKSEDMAVLMQAAAARAGITLDTRRVPADGYWSSSWMKVPIGFGNVNSRPTVDTVFTQFFRSDAPWNESGWRNERFDRLLIEARGLTDQKLRKEIYSDMQRMIHEEAGIGIPLFLSSLDAHSPRVKGLKPMPNGGLMGFGFAEHVWLEDA